jgi:predicted N-acyltransferase
MFSFCDKILAKNSLKPNRKLFSKYTFTCFEDIHLVPESEWTNALQDKNVFLSHAYLSVLHKEKTESFWF